MSSKLPNPSGNYAVACTDILPSAGRNSVFFRLFYPTPDYEATQENLAPWIEESEYTYGYSRFLNLSLLKFVLNKFIGNERIPVLWQGPLLNRDKEEVKDFPVIMFSHGLGGNRTSNTYYCYEMASYGFIVASIEHKDLSASATYFLKNADNGTLKKEWMYMIKLDDNDAGKLSLRNMQVQERMEESTKCLDHLEELNAGNLSNIVSEFDLSAFKGKLDINLAAMIGHSFGGATTLLASKDDSRLKVVCVLDPWMEPIDTDLSKSLYEVEFQQPILILNSEKFQSATTSRLLDKIKLADTKEKKILEMHGLVHQSFSDFSLILPHSVAKLSGTIGSLDSVFANRVVTELMLKFIGNELDLPFKGSIEEVLDKHDFIVDESFQRTEACGTND